MVNRHVYFKYKVHEPWNQQKCKHTHTHTRMHMHTRMLTHTHTHTHTHMHARKYIRMYARTHARTNVWTPTHMLTHTYTHTYTQPHTHVCSRTYNCLQSILLPWVLFGTDTRLTTRINIFSFGHFGLLDTLSLTVSGNQHHHHHHHHRRRRCCRRRRRHRLHHRHHHSHHHRLIRVLFKGETYLQNLRGSQLCTYWCGLSCNYTQAMFFTIGAAQK